jgi:hypothetical protein
MNNNELTTHITNTYKPKLINLYNEAISDIAAGRFDLASIAAIFAIGYKAKMEEIK